MKKAVYLLTILFLGFFIIAAATVEPGDARPRVILLISEQNIQSPQRAWWASEIDLSVTETKLAKGLINSGFKVIEPSSVTKSIKRDQAFRMLDISQEKSVELGVLSKADYVILGKALASSGAKVPQSNMVSCFANLTARVISVKDGNVIAYLDASGSSAHLDAISGGREALNSAAQDLAAKIIQVLTK